MVGNTPLYEKGIKETQNMPMETTSRQTRIGELSRDREVYRPKLPGCYFSWIYLGKIGFLENGIRECM